MKNTNQSGRSMVEMLGVLAIIGVLSVGGIAGYAKAMSKYKLNKVEDQVSHIVANLRTIFLNANDYSLFGDTPVKTAIKLGVFPNDMIVDEETVKNPYGGTVTLETVPVDGHADWGFKLTYNGLPKEAAIHIGTADWGDGDKIGLKELKINGNNDNP